MGAGIVKGAIDQGNAGMKLFAMEQFKSEW